MWKGGHCSNQHGNGVESWGDHVKPVVPWTFDCSVDMRKNWVGHYVEKKASVLHISFFSVVSFLLLVHVGVLHASQLHALLAASMRPCLWLAVPRSLHQCLSLVGRPCTHFWNTVWCGLGGAYLLRVSHRGGLLVSFHLASCEHGQASGVFGASVCCTGYLFQFAWALCCWWFCHPIWC